jgi:hypothetical protein
LLHSGKIWLRCGERVAAQRKKIAVQQKKIAVQREKIAAQRENYNAFAGQQF